MSAVFDALAVGGVPAGLAGAMYLARFRRSVVVVDAADAKRRLAEAGIVLHAQAVTDLALDGDDVIVTPGERRIRCDLLHAALGMKAHSDLAAALGAALDADGDVLTDRHQQTGVPGVYCAGDAAQGLNQISVAIGAAATAASAMHLQLSPPTR